MGRDCYGATLWNRPGKGHQTLLVQRLGIFQIVVAGRNRYGVRQRAQMNRMADAVELRWGRKSSMASLCCGG